MCLTSLALEQLSAESRQARFGHTDLAPCEHDTGTGAGTSMLLMFMTMTMTGDAEQAVAPCCVMPAVRVTAACSAAKRDKDAKKPLRVTHARWRVGPLVVPADLTQVGQVGAAEVTGKHSSEHELATI